MEDLHVKLAYLKFLKWREAEAINRHERADEEERCKHKHCSKPSQSKQHQLPNSDFSKY